MKSYDFKDFNWQTESLSSDDAALVEAYERVGTPLDSLAYTPEFKELAKKVGKDPVDEAELHKLYVRLLNIRKRGLLPRTYQ